MKFTITDTAVQWFTRELELVKGDFVRFFVRMGGCSTVQAGYSLGIEKDTPMETGKTFETKGLTFYIEEKISGILMSTI